MPAPIKKATSPWDRYKKASNASRPRIVAASVGEVGSGKTSFWLSAPGPIVVQSLDMGLEGVVERFQETKDIYVAEYDWSPGGDDPDDATVRQRLQDEARDLRDKFIADFEHALTCARTIVWDKETLVWELFRYAEFGAPNDAPRNYPLLNQRYRKYVNMPKSVDVNFGCIQGLKDEWVTKAKADGGTKGVSTGGRIRKGFSELDELVHIDLFHRREGGKFLLDVGKSRGPGGQDVQDQTFENLTFGEFGQLVFPGTTSESWE